MMSAYRRSLSIISDGISSPPGAGAEGVSGIGGAEGTRDAAGGSDAAAAADVDAVSSRSDADADATDGPVEIDAMYFSNTSRVTMFSRRRSTVYFKLWTVAKSCSFETRDSEFSLSPGIRDKSAATKCGI